MILYVREDQEIPVNQDNLVLRGWLETGDHEATAGRRGFPEHQWVALSIEGRSYIDSYGIQLQ